jgi:Bacterial TSP3 repeat
MASFSRKTGIIGALVIAGVLIAGAYILSSPNPSSLLSFLKPNTANAESTTLLLQQYAAKDSDNDGLPDWEEELYGTNPNNPHSISPTLTDGQEVAQGFIKPKFMTATPSSLTPASTLAGQPAGAPDSLTDQFTQSMMSQFLAQNAQDGGTPPSDEDVATFAETSMQNFAIGQEHQNEYTQSQVKVSGSGPDALRAYAAAMEQAFRTPGAAGTSNESEIDYFSDAVQKNDPSQLIKVAAIGKTYTAMAPAIMQVQVPSEAQYAHLEIANAAARLGADITDMSTMETDPLRAYLGLAQYQADATSLASGFADMGSVFANEHVTMALGDPGYYFYSFASKVQAPASTGTTAPN